MERGQKRIDNSWRKTVKTKTDKAKTKKKELLEEKLEYWILKNWQYDLI